MNLLAHIVSGAGLMLGLAAYHVAAQPPPAPPDFDIVTRHAIQKSLPLIQNAAAGFSAKAKCVSCHNQSLPQMVVGVARLRGFSVDEKQARAQNALMYETFLHMKPLMQTALQSPAAEKQLDVLMVDPAITIGYMLAGMGASGQKPEALTGMMAQYMARKQDASGRWPVNTARPPMETSDFTATAQGVYALKTYGVSGAQTEARISKARAWLLAASPRNTEDKAFRLFGLRWAGAESAAITQAAQDLLADQRDDGGWGQLPALPSDAYATGETLTALHEAGGLPPIDAAYQRGRFFLLNTQASDGSWFVPKRAITVQPYVEAGYPYKNAQFISVGGACWATIALLYTVEGPRVGATAKNMPAAAAPAAILAPARETTR